MQQFAFANCATKCEDCELPIIQDNNKIKRHSEDLSPKNLKIFKSLRCFADAQQDKDAFTLAETLITLVIVGAIAALTVPNLIVKYQKEQTVTRLKAGYSILNQAINKSISEHGQISSWTFPTNESEYDSFYYEHLYKYLQLSTKLKENHRLFSIDNNNFFYSSEWYYLQNGAGISIYSNAQSGYVWIFYDINGRKGPNKVGRDVFQLALKSLLIESRNIAFWGQGINRYGLKYASGNGGYDCRKGTNNRYAGGFCGALIFYDGWQIADDYPW